MTSTLDDLLTALELVAARVPDRQVSPDRAMAVAWFVDLERFDREALFAAARGWGELRFPSAGQFLSATMAAAQELAAARAESQAVDGGPCRNDGCDQGWVELDTVGHGTVRPCEWCRPVEHAVWRHRSDPGHPERCGECVKIRKGTIKDRPDWLADAYQRQASGSTPDPEPAF